MSEFHVTPQMAEARIEEVRTAGEAVGLPADFVDTVDYSAGEREDLERYLNDHGIQFFSTREVVTPHHEDKAAEAGFSELVPPLHLWPWTLIVLRIGDIMREEVGRAVRLRNVYRPMSYNRLVASSGIDSDHPNACSGDFDFSSQDDRRTAEQVVRDLSSAHPELEISLGMGARSLHVGALSPKGKRSWFYDSYSDPRVPLE